MAKTMIIKDADFSTNKVTTVSFGTVPCTGISFSQDTFSLSNYTPVSIEYTLTPANTTDTLSWASSDTDVATVDGGVITAVGLGTATITATCGTQTATATVTVAIECNPAFAMAYITGVDGNTWASNSLAELRVAAYGSGAQAGTYICPRSTGTDMPVIKIPKNTGSVTFAFSDVTRLKYSDDEIDWWFKDESAGVQDHPDAAKVILKGSWYYGYSTPTKTINVPEGADSLLYSFMVSTVEAGETAADLAEAVGFTITFNTGTV